MSSSPPQNTSQEILRSAFASKDRPLVSQGLPFPDACLKHVSTTFNVSRIYIISSGSLARNTDALERLQRALEGRVVGTRVGMKPHTYFREVLEIVHDAREARADCIVTLGGSSLTDGAKVVALALANDVVNAADLLALPHIFDKPGSKPHAQPSAIPIISIPTTLSGAEYTKYGGVTEDGTNIKYQFGPLQGPQLVILDAQLAASTPVALWLSTGVRCVDHRVETLGSLLSDAASDAAAADSFAALLVGLLRTRADPSDAEARGLCLAGGAGAMTFLARGVPLGASHGIGHMLGPLGVGHGETSCVLLPAVCKYNAAHSAAAGRRQLRVLELLWGDATLRALLTDRGLHEGTADLGDALDVYIRELGMPRTLREVGIGRDQLDRLAEASLKDRWLPTNPVPITEKEQVMEILKMVE
ncbi:hypothetical protein HWV62_35226 [Athelia sp. TMB]|nr:hypothetical protein HWV62_35226 [Athelia sp. TMB]